MLMWRTFVSLGCASCFWRCHFSFSIPLLSISHFRSMSLLFLGRWASEIHCTTSMLSRFSDSSLCDLPILLHRDIFAWLVLSGAGVVRVTCAGVRWGTNAFRAYAWVAAGSVVLWYGWKLTHCTFRGLYVSVSRTMRCPSSIAWRYRAGVALGKSLDFFCSPILEWFPAARTVQIWVLWERRWSTLCTAGCWWRGAGCYCT